MTIDSRYHTVKIRHKLVAFFTLAKTLCGVNYELIAILTLTFLLAGTIKGIIGLGLPTVSLGIMSLVLDLETAMTLLLVPSFSTNLWQALLGGNVVALLLRLCPFLLPAIAAVWLGTGLFALFQPIWLEAVLGLLLILYATIGLGGFQHELNSIYEKPVGVICGFVNGVLTGLTGSFVMPGVMFLQTLRLDRQKFVQAMGILFTLSTLSLALALHSHGRLTLSLSLLSTFGLIPAIIGMVIGRKICHLLAEKQFRQIFFTCILGLGLAIINSAIW